MSNNRRQGGRAAGRGFFGFSDSLHDDDAGGDESAQNPLMETLIASKIADLLARLQLSTASAGDDDAGNGAGAFSQQSSTGWGGLDWSGWNEDRDDGDAALRDGGSDALPAADQASMLYRLASTLRDRRDEEEEEAHHDGGDDEDEDDEDEDYGYGDDDGCGDGDEQYDDGHDDSNDCGYKHDYPLFRVPAEGDGGATLRSLHERATLSQLARRMRGFYDTYRTKDSLQDDSYASALMRGASLRVSNAAAAAAGTGPVAAGVSDLANVYGDDVDVMKRPQPAHTSLTAPDPHSASAFVQELLLSSFDDDPLW